MEGCFAAEAVGEPAAAEATEELAESGEVVSGMMLRVGWFW